MNISKLILFADKYINHGPIHYIYRVAIFTFFTVFIGGFWFGWSATDIKYAVIVLWSLMLLYYGWVTSRPRTEEEEKTSEDEEPPTSSN